MAFNLDQFNTDPNLEVEGVWVDLDEWNPDIPEDDHAMLLLAKADNPKYTAFVESRIQQNSRRMQADETKRMTILRGIQREGMARFVLLDWKNIVFEGGRPKYTPEIGMRALKSNQLRSMVDEYSNDHKRYQRAQEEEAEKN